MLHLIGSKVRYLGLVGRVIDRSFEGGIWRVRIFVACRSVWVQEDSADIEHLEHATHLNIADLRW